MNLKKSKHGMSSKQASEKKLGGHAKERQFNKQFGNPDAEINYSGASADCMMREDHPVYKKLKKDLKMQSRFVSIKGGVTWQFLLGNHPELTDRNKMKVSKTPRGYTKVEHGISFDDQKKVLHGNAYWERVLHKGDFLVHLNEAGWTFFNMDDVVAFIQNKCEWKLLETGRLKGRFYNAEKGNKRQYLTYEYRKQKDSFVMGAHGGQKGKEFFELLKQNLKYHTEKKW